jgi:hypothetical protein
MALRSLHLGWSRLSAVCASLSPVFLAAVARAQDAAEERSQSFQAVKGAVQEDVPGGPLLVYAYGFILLLLVGYLVRLVRLQQRSEREVARLAQQLGKSGS